MEPEKKEGMRPSAPQQAATGKALMETIKAKDDARIGKGEKPAP